MLPLSSGWFLAFNLMIMAGLKIFEGYNLIELNIRFGIRVKIDGYGSQAKFQNLYTELTLSFVLHLYQTEEQGSAVLFDWERHVSEVFLDGQCQLWVLYLCAEL